MEVKFPKAFAHLMKVRAKLEKHYKEMQDIEFTVENGKLFMLQTRRGKRTAHAAVRIAVEMVKEGLIDVKTALRSIPAGELTKLLLPYFDAKDKKGVVTLTTGLGASPGAVTGKLAFTAEEAVERARNGESVLLVRAETSPEDVDGMHSAVGILTSTGGKTSHAAVVAVGWGKCCVVGSSPDVNRATCRTFGAISLLRRSIFRCSTNTRDPTGIPRLAPKNGFLR